MIQSHRLTGARHKKFAPRPRNGFTLIEVLVAMVILAIGLLGLAGLGVSAARSLVGADVRSGFAVAAAEDLELALGEIRNGSVLQKCVTSGPFNDRLSRTIDTSNPNLPRVTVTMLPGSGRSMTLQPFTVTRAVHTPSPTGSASGSPCS